MINGMEGFHNVDNLNVSDWSSKNYAENDVRVQSLRSIDTS